MHTIAALFFIVFLLVLGVLVIIATYVEEIARRLRSMSHQKPARRVVASKRLANE